MSGVHKVVREAGYPFTMVPNEAVRDPRLSSTAFRLLAYLLSHENGYELTYRQIERQTGMGRFAINEGIKALTGLSWLRVERPKRPNGQYGPKAWHLLNPTTVGNSTMEPLHSGTTNALKKNTKKEKKTSRAIAIPEPLKLHIATLEVMQEKYPKLDLAEQRDAFVDYHTAKGSVYKDWDAAFRNWCRNAVKFAEPKTVIHKQEVKAAAELPDRRGWVLALHKVGEHYECQPGEFGCK